MKVSPFFYPLEYPSLKDEYLEEIKEPMCFNDILTKTENYDRYTMNQFYNDIQLIWSNCKIFNQDDPVMIKHANDLEKTVKNLFPSLISKAKDIQKEQFLNEDEYSTFEFDENVLTKKVKKDTVSLNGDMFLSKKRGRTKKEYSSLLSNSSTKESQNKSEENLPSKVNKRERISKSISKGKKNSEQEDCKLELNDKVKSKNRKEETEEDETGQNTRRKTKDIEEEEVKKKSLTEGGQEENSVESEKKEEEKKEYMFFSNIKASKNGELWDVHISLPNELSEIKTNNSNIYFTTDEENKKKKEQNTKK